MARIELRDCTIRIKDGLSGTALITEGERAEAILDSNAANGDLTFTAPNEGTVYNGTTFDTQIDANGVAVTYDVNSDAFTVNVDGANDTALDVKTEWDNQMLANPTWPQWTCDTEGAGGGVVDVALSDVGAGGVAEPAANDTDVNISTVVLNTTETDLVPVGSRFTPSTVNHDTVHTVTARTPSGAGPTTNIVFTPAWGSPTPVKGDTLNFLPQQIDIKIGEGNLTYTEAKEYEYLLDRGVLDTVKEGDEQPLEVSLEFVYEHVTTGTAEAITPVDALKQKGGADEWVSSSSDLCEPYAVNMEIEHNVSCGGTQDEITVLSDFRYESLEFNFQDATISVSGRCNVSEAIITRS